MKKYFIAVSIILVMLNIINVFGNDYDILTEKKIIDDYYFENQSVTRYKGLIPLMKIMGVDDETAEFYAGIDFSVPVFRDLYLDSSAEEGYIIIAGLNNIAIGDNLQEKAFNGERELKVGEMLLFAMRCVDGSAQFDINTAYEKAKALGIVLDEDGQACNLNSNISMEYYLTILSRMMDLSEDMEFKLDTSSYDEYNEQLRPVDSR